MEAAFRGNLGEDPDVSRNDTGVRTRLRVAADQTAADREAGRPPVWIDVEVWDDLAQRCADVLKKGHPVLVLGRWVRHEWETKEGEKRSKTYVRGFAVGPDLSRAEVPSVDRQRVKPAATTEDAPDPAGDDPKVDKEEPNTTDTTDPFDED